uniref:Chemokine interleukin-8-like domain-containing protein n=1 Tax=Lepisosteus oculatus TaxID=7918 RepID=W5M6H7_LEPOC
RQDLAMKFSVLFFCLLLACLYLSMAQGSYENCCLKYVHRVSKTVKKNIIEYRRQKTDGGCNLPAIVFKMRNRKLFCANPNEKWVEDVINKIDRKIKRVR